MDFNKQLQETQQSQTKPTLDTSNLLFDAKEGKFGIQLHDQNYVPFGNNSNQEASPTTPIKYATIFLLGSYDDLVSAQVSSALVKYNSTAFTNQTDPIELYKHTSQRDAQGKFSTVTETIAFDTYRNIKSSRPDLKQLTKYRKTLLGYLVAIDGNPIDFSGTNPLGLTTPLVKFSTKGINLNRIFESGSELGTNYLTILAKQEQVTTDYGSFYALNYMSARLTEDNQTPSIESQSVFANKIIAQELKTTIEDPQFVAKAGQYLDTYNNKVNDFIRKLTTIDQSVTLDKSTQTNAIQQSTVPMNHPFSETRRQPVQEQVQSDPFAELKQQSQVNQQQSAPTGNDPLFNSEPPANDFPTFNDGLPF
ncbi:hypothetical protein [Pseudolactococcus insecticola]|uniref:Uncharacterized protein n=1 Tax=Pseudolactococcus insecticola TaxID=2709158 RepID=A0A6A0B7L1_9LACT|nr:hypothetical protein [Lactococcus insecticola]GFH41399.1 hypothetical protein Hs20B_17970 [Lactococcus insecticola]